MKQAAPTPRKRRPISPLSSRLVGDSPLIALLLAPWLKLPALPGFATELNLNLSPAELDLRVGAQTWRFDQFAGRWALAGVEVNDRVVARPLSSEDSFGIGGGEALSYEMLTNVTDHFKTSHSEVLCSY